MFDNFCAKSRYWNQVDNVNLDIMIPNGTSHLTVSPGIKKPSFEPKGSWLTERQWMIGVSNHLRKAKDLKLSDSKPTQKIWSPWKQRGHLRPWHFFNVFPFFLRSLWVGFFSVFPGWFYFLRLPGMYSSFFVQDIYIWYMFISSAKQVTWKIFCYIATHGYRIIGESYYLAKL